jgi:DNA mismatch repair ATPase MutS
MIDPILREEQQVGTFGALTFSDDGVEVVDGEELRARLELEDKELGVDNDWIDLASPVSPSLQIVTTLTSKFDSYSFVRAFKAADKGELTQTGNFHITTGQPIIDSATIKELELKELFYQIKQTQTHCGDVFLYGSMISPQLPNHLMIEKQNAVKLLSEDLLVNASIADFLKTFAEFENCIVSLLDNETYSRSNELSKFANFIVAIDTLRKKALELSECEDPVINKALEAIKIQLFREELSIENLSLYYDGILLSSLTEKPTPNNKNQKSISTFSDAKSFGEEIVRIIGFGVATFGITATSAATVLFPNQAPETFIFGVICSAIATFFSVVSNQNSIYKREDKVASMWRQLIQKRLGEDFFPELLTSVGLLDELSSLASLKYKFQEACLPTIVDSEVAVFEVENLVSTLLTLDGIDCVSNDLKLSGDKITILTGPNSGGKSTLALAIEHATLLGMIGGYVPARKFTMTRPDYISHQGPEMGDSKKREGRFGYEGGITLSRVRTARNSGMNLIFIDEMSQGTNPDEALTHARNFAHAFHSIGGVNLIITQDFRLAKILETEGIAQCLQFEFKDGQSTHKVIPGIAKSSRSEVVAERVGFHREGLNEILLEKGKNPISAIDPNLLKHVMNSEN